MQTQQDHLPPSEADDYFDPAPEQYGRGVILPLEKMTDRRYAAFAHDYYNHPQLFGPYFGEDTDGNPIAPHGMSKHGVPKLHPDHE